MSLMARLQLMRPGNAVMSAVGVAIGILLGATRDLDGLDRVWLAPLGAALIAGAGNTFNDIRDLDVDRVAHPGRPLPSGRISLRAASAWSLILLVAGLVCAALAGGALTLLFAATVAGVLWLYETALKQRGLPGNLAVAALVAATMPFGALASGASPLARLPLEAAAMAFGVNLAREIVKDVQDEAADRGSRRTLPMWVGAGRATGVAAVAAGLGVMASVFVLADVAAVLREAPSNGESILFLATLVLADLAAIAAVLLSFLSPKAGQRAYKLAMVMALLAFARHGLVLTF